MQINLKLPKMYPKQHEAIFSDARYSICEAGTKTGKTFGCLVWLLRLAFETGKPGRNFWWVAPVYPQAEIGFNRMRRMLRRADPNGQTWSANASRVAITLVNGAVITFKSGEKPDNLYGEDVYGVVVDEATRCRADSWYAIRSTVTFTKAQVRIIGNVKGRKNWVYALARKAEAGEPDHNYVRITCHDAVDAGILDAAEIEDARQQLPEHIFRELYLAEASDDEGNPFGIDHIRACVGGPADWRADKPIVAWGVDLAKYRDWTVALGLNQDGQVAGFQRWQSDWRNTVARLTAMIGNVPAIVDATGVGDPVFEEIRLKCQAAEGQKFTAASKQEMIYGLSSALHQREISYPANEIMFELESFEYTVKMSNEGRLTGVRWEAAIGHHDDCVTALGLAVMCLRSRRYSPCMDVEVDMIDPEEDDYEDVWVTLNA